MIGIVLLSMAVIYCLFGSEVDSDLSTLTEADQKTIIDQQVTETDAEVGSVTIQVDSHLGRSGSLDTNTANYGSPDNPSMSQSTPYSASSSSFFSSEEFSDITPPRLQ